MGSMVKERGGMVYGMDERYCINKGAIMDSPGWLGDVQEWTDHTH